jgi:hypothetical protein
MQVVHISPSALAGAPGMLSDALQAFGHVDTSVHFRAGDHGPDRQLMSPDSVPLNDNPADRDMFAARVEAADIVHVHNFVPDFVLGWLAELPKRDRKFIYQVHSPKYERPIFGDMSADHGLAFTAHLVVCHFHPRHFPDFRPIPNCLYRRAFRALPSRKPTGRDPVRVMYSPSTRSTDRWARKSDTAFEHAIKLIGRDGRFALRVLGNVPPQVLAERRLLSDVTIDEVVTGSFHLVSYEGLAAGTAVINGADVLSMAAFQIGFRSPPPPFLRCTPLTLQETLLALHADREYLAQRQEAARTFFDEWMNPRRISGMYANIYRE